RVPLEDYLKIQGRFKHLFKPENKWLLEKLKNDIDEMWNWIKEMLAK
ncbi:pyruvate ferredoxin oxidoreductase, partial [Candidatus Geothermarchaeota archaeon]